MAKSPPSDVTVIPSPRLLAAARLVAGLSQTELGALAGVHRSAIARYENGLTRMRTDKLELLVSALGTCGVVLFGRLGEWEGGIAVLAPTPASRKSQERAAVVANRRLRSGQAGTALG